MMSKGRARNFVLLLLLALLGINSFACSSPTSVPVSDTPTSTATSTALPKTNTPTPTPEIPFRVDETCWPIKPFKDSPVMDGSLVFTKSWTNGFFIWDLSSFGVKAPQIEDKNIGYALNFSPNGEKIIIPTVDQSSGRILDKVLVISEDETKLFANPQGLRHIGEFLYNSNLRFGNYRNPDPNRTGFTEHIDFTDKYSIFDSTTGIWSSNDIFLPDLALFQPYTLSAQGHLPNYQHLFAIRYSPDMHYVAYLSGDTDGNYSLVDLTTRKVIWDHPKLPPHLLGDIDTIAGWKPDASAITLIYRDKDLARGPYTDLEHAENLYSISLDGTVSPITQFKKKVIHLINYDHYENEYYVAHYPFWSSDGRYLTFQARPANQDTTLQLYVWDDQEKVAFKPCITGQIYGGLIWSFDNRHAFLRLHQSTLELGPDKTPSSDPFGLIDVILDIPNKTIFRLPDQNNRGEFSTIYREGYIKGWVNWEVP